MANVTRQEKQLIDALKALVFSDEWVNRAVESRVTHVVRLDKHMYTKEEVKRMLEELNCVVRW